MEKTKVDFIKEYDTLLEQLNDIEYIKAQKLLITVGKDKWQEEVMSEIADSTGSFPMKRVPTSGYRLNIRLKDDTLYTRTMEGDTNESRYLVLYYTYRDILNAGLQLIHLTFVEQSRMLNEIALAHSNLKPGQKIIA